MTYHRGGVGDARQLGLVMSGRQALGTCRPTLVQRVAREARWVARGLWFPAVCVAVIAAGALATLRS